MIKKTKLYSFLFASSIGTYLEFFDLALFSFCSSIIAKQFFPEGDPLVATLATWGIFAISYLMRPLGAVWFGYLADAKSSKRAMVISMAMMSFATIGIGFMPNYNQVGMWAPLGLLVLRIIQSIAVAPEYNLPSVFIKNNSWFKEHFGLVSSLSACVTGLGMMSASWVMSLLLSDGGYHQWRAPFIIAGFFLGTVGIYMRANIDETMLPVPPKAVPLQMVCFGNTKEFLFAILIAGYIGCISYALFGFLIHQLQVVKNLGIGEALGVLSVGSLMPASFSLLAGYLSDKVDRKYLMLSSSILMGICGYYLFGNLHLLDVHTLTVLTCIMLAGLGFFAGSFPGMLAELFSKEYRYTGAFLSYNIGMSWIGGLCPWVLIKVSGYDYMLPAYIIAAYSILVILLMESRIWKVLTTVVASLLPLRASKELANQPK